MSSDQQLDKDDVVHTTEHCLATGKDEARSFATAWMDPESVMLSEVSQMEKD